MGTVEGKKQEKRRALLEAAYDLFLERGAAKTSVEDITSRAKVAKGTFYLYFQDKGAVMQALLGRVSYQLLSNACEAVEKQTELENFPDKMVAVIDHIIEALRKDTLVLKFLEHNFIWPGLDQIEASREAEPLMRKLLNVVLTSPEMAGRTEREIYQRITALGSMCMSVCYSSVLEGKPDDIEAMKFNTAIATMMSLVNDFYANGVSKGDMKALLVMLSPFAPHIAEEMWEHLGFEAMACEQAWPEYDQTKTVAAEVQIAVQVAGKVRANVIVPSGAEDDEVVAIAMADNRIQKQAEGKELVKQIVVRAKDGKIKLVNLIFKPAK